MRAAGGWKLILLFLVSGLISPLCLPANTLSSGFFSSSNQFSSGLFLDWISTFPSNLQATGSRFYSDPAKELDLLIKVLKFERQTNLRSGEPFIIAIISQKSDSVSAWLASDWLALNDRLKQKDTRIYDRPVTIVDLDLDSFPPGLLEEKLRQAPVDLVYFGALNLKNDSTLVKDICRLCARLKIGTFTANPEQLDSGVALAFSLGKEKAEIIINLEAARTQGFNFSSRLLHLVNIRKANEISGHN
jgi:hypothetical protein